VQVAPSRAAELQTARQCSRLQDNVAHCRLCSTLQHTASAAANSVQGGGPRPAPPLSSTLQRTATHYHALQHHANVCSTVQDTAARRAAEYRGFHAATHCNALQHNATHGGTLQHTAAHCNTLQHTAPLRIVASALQQQGSEVQCSVPTLSLPRCNTLQHV